MKILMFGRTGQVAREVLRARPETVALGREEADLSDPIACAAHVERTDADIVMNAAAWTDVDGAESAEPQAALANGAAPTAMAAAAAARGLPFLHISTDYVFDGGAGRPWREADEPRPVSAYGWTKLAGEQGVRAAGGPHVILRTSWVFSAHGRNFVKTMLRAGAERDRLTVVDDQTGGPTPAAAIAGALLTIADAFHRGDGVTGAFHFSGAPAVTWAGFAREIMAQAGLNAEIAPIASEDWPTPAKRPQNSVLDCGAIRAAYGIDQPDWRAGLAAVLADLEGDHA